MSANTQPLIYDLILEARRVNKSSPLSLPDLLKNLSKAYDVAEQATAQRDEKLRTAGEKLLMALINQNVSGTPGGSGSHFGATAAPIPATGAHVAAPIPSSVTGKTYDREWAKMGDAALEVAGPIGLKMVKQLAQKNLSQDPSSMGSELEKMLSKEIAQGMLREYRTKR